MDVTIIGTGSMARGIGTRTIAGGHDVTVVGKDEASAQQVVADLGSAPGEGSLALASSNRSACSTWPCRRARDELRQRRQAALMTPADEPAPTVTDNVDQSRFELHLDGELAGFAEYGPAGDSVIIAHTEIADGHEGEGLGGTLVRGALERIRSNGKTVIPTCPFTAAYIRRHPEFVELVAPALRDQFDRQG